MIADPESLWGPITGHFSTLYDTVPAGPEPEDIRRQWMGLGLPIRLGALIHQTELRQYMGDSHNFPLQEIPIVAIDATNCLTQAGRTEAGQFWRAQMGPLNLLLFSRTGGHVVLFL